MSGHRSAGSRDPRSAVIKILDELRIVDPVALCRQLVTTKGYCAAATFLGSTRVCSTSSTPNQSPILQHADHPFRESGTTLAGGGLDLILQGTMQRRRVLTLEYAIDLTDRSTRGSGPAHHVGDGDLTKGSRSLPPGYSRRLRDRRNWPDCLGSYRTRRRYGSLQREFKLVFAM